MIDGLQELMDKVIRSAKEEGDVEILELFENMLQNQCKIDKISDEMKEEYEKINSERSAEETIIENGYKQEIKERTEKGEKYRTKGLEMLMYDGVHPDKIGQQHENWDRTWVSISDVVGSIDYDYHGLGYIYFVNYVDGTFHCIDPDKVIPISMREKLENAEYDDITEEEEIQHKKNIKKLIKESGYDEDTCVPVTVSCHSCMVVDKIDESW